MDVINANEPGRSPSPERPRVLVTGAQLVPEATELLDGAGVETVYAPAYSTSEDLARMASENDVLAILVRQGDINADVIEASPRLRVIAKHGSGVDNIDLNAATKRQIPVLRALAANAQSVAELAIAHTLSLMKDITLLNTTVKGGDWPKSKYVGRDIAGAVFGVIGFGEIGQRAAALASGLGMRVIAYDPIAEEKNSIPVSRSIDDVLREADVVSLHCPLTPETRHLINEDRLKLMKLTAFLVNTARGSVVDEKALEKALLSGDIAGAALDSFEQEPPLAESSLWRLPNLIASPHVGGASRSALRNMAVQSVTHILNVIEGKGFDQRALANRDITQN